MGLTHVLPHLLSDSPVAAPALKRDRAIRDVVVAAHDVHACVRDASRHVLLGQPVLQHDSPAEKCGCIAIQGTTADRMQLEV